MSEPVDTTPEAVERLADELMPPGAVQVHMRIADDRLGLRSDAAAMLRALLAEREEMERQMLAEHQAAVDQYRRAEGLLAERDQLAAAVAEARREGMREAADMMDCGCDEARKAAAVAAKPNSVERWNACGEANCCAIDAAFIRSAAEEPRDE